LAFLFYPLAIIAFLMVLFLSVLVAQSVRARTGINAVVVILLLGMMIAMLIGPAYLYLATLTLTLGDIVVWEIAVFSAVGMMPIAILVAAQFVMESDSERTKPLPLTDFLHHITALRVSYVLLTVLSEILMGWTFNIAYGVVTLSSGYSAADVLNQLSYSLTTYWFIFTMVGEMFLTVYIFRKTIRPSLLELLCLQMIVMFLTPTALPWHAWETYTFYLEAVAMTGVVVYAINYVRTRKGERDQSLVMYIGLFIVANALMMAGLLWWLISGATWTLSPILVLETTLYFDAVLTGAGLSGKALDERRAAEKAKLSLPSSEVQVDDGGGGDDDRPLTQA
jgi:uncharacterized membrane protein